MPNPRGRPPLGVGTHGDIHHVATPAGHWQARARYRDRTGHTVTVTKTGQTKAAATRALKAALADLAAGTSYIGTSTTVETLAERWLAEEILPSDRRGPTTKEQYASFVKRYIVPTVGRLRIAEVTPSACNRAFARISAEHGKSAAISAKKVLSGIMDHAVSEDAILANPVKSTRRLPRGEKSDVRALTPDECTDMCDRLRCDHDAILYDLPDVVEFMLGTGVRAGEALAAREQLLDEAPGVFEVKATMIRLKKDKGGLQIQERTKTDAGWRVIAVPPVVLDLVERRRGEARFRHSSGVIFPSSHRNSLRDPSNFHGRLREALDRVGYPWVHGHVFRKTVATRLDEAGLTARQIADHLGHEHPSMTLDVYMGRNVVVADAATILDRR